MQGVDRRRMLRAALCGAAAATVGLALMAGAGEATPLALEKKPGGKADDLLEEAQVGPPGPSLDSRPGPSLGPRPGPSPHPRPGPGLRHGHSSHYVRRHREATKPPPP